MSESLEGLGSDRSSSEAEVLCREVVVLIFASCRPISLGGRYLSALEWSWNGVLLELPQLHPSLL